MKLNNIRNNFNKIFTLIRLSCSKLIVVTFVIIVLNSLIAPVVTWLFKLLVDEISSPEINKVLSNKIIYIIVLYMFLKIITEALEVITSHISIKMNYNINNEISKNVNRKLSKIELEELESPHIYDLLNRIQINISQGALNFINSIVSMITPLFSLLSYMVLLLSINIYFPIISLVATIPYLILVMNQGKDSYFQIVSQSKESRKLDYMYDIMTSREYAKEIRVFNLVDFLNKKTEDIRDNLWKEKYKLLLRYSLRGILIDILRNISLGICLFITCIDVLHDKTSIGNVMLVITSIQAITNNFSTLIGKIASVSKFSLYINDWIEFLTLPEESICPQVKIKDTTIAVKDLSFKYPNSEQICLNKINITIKPGQRIALVGENGSGKTTFIKLLMGIYKPSKGNVFIGNNSLTEVIEDFREKTICIFQDFIKYQMSVEDNIKAGNFGLEFNQNMLNSLHLNEFINSLPNGIKTQLGQLDGNAFELSGGEWQKLAIARILSRENAKILVMDEPTASLDPKIENEIYENLHDICQDKTAILISHRLAATKLCDKIYVFDHGSIIENGSHSELMVLKGKYYEMYSAQSSLYN
ncbi:MAG: ABC transporter ATP-binding protein [Anaerocolumna sp.]